MPVDFVTGLGLDREGLASRKIWRENWIQDGKTMMIKEPKNK
jgi:hypothetical protein